MRSLLRYLLYLSCILQPACANWDQPPPQLALPTPRMSRDSVVLEIEFVRFDPSREADFQSLWKALDEQHLPLDLRRVLAANGLRCGIVGSQLPAELREALEDKRPLLEQLEAGEIPEQSDGLANYRRLSCRAGREYPIVASTLDGDRVVMIRDGDHVRAESLSQAQGFITLESAPRGDGRIDIRLTPLVHHGDLRQKWSAGQGNFIYEPGRSKRRFDLLKLDATLSAGSTLVLASSSDPKGLGAWYFGAAGERRVMLIRLAQTQYDDLFLNETGDASLTTFRD